MTLTAVATPINSDTPPRIRIDLTTTAGATDLFTLYRNDPDGRQRPVILEVNSHFTSSAWSGWDYHAPFNQAVSYTVVSGVLQASSSQVTLTMAQSWLQHPTNPALSVPIDKVMSVGERVTASTATTHWAFGAHYPVTRSEGVRRARTGTLTFQAQSSDSLTDLRALLIDSGVILMNLVTGGWSDESCSWILPGDQTDTNPADGWVYYPTRNLSFPYQMVDTPSGNVAPLWTYATLLADIAMPAYSSLITEYANYGNMVIDYRQV